MLSPARLEEAVYGCGEVVASNAIEVHLRPPAPSSARTPSATCAASAIASLMRPSPAPSAGLNISALSVDSLLIVGASYLATLEEMNEVLDDNLRQVAMTVAVFTGLPTTARRPRTASCRRCRRCTTSAAISLRRPGLDPRRAPAILSDPTVSLPVSDSAGWRA